MYRIFKLVLVSCLMQQVCLAQKNYSLTPYYVQFVDNLDNTLKLVSNFKPDQHKILFKGGFRSDTLKIFIDNKFRQEMVLTSDKSLSNTEKYFDFYCTKCRVRLLDGGDCIEFIVFDEYKLVVINKVGRNDEWYVTFSNYYWFSE